jgi:hypothetical protein
MLPSTGEKTSILGQGWQSLLRQSTPRERENNSSSSKIRADKQETSNLHQQWNGGYGEANGGPMLSSP